MARIEESYEQAGVVCTKDNCSVCDAIENSAVSDYKPFLSHFGTKMLIGVSALVLGLYIGLFVALVSMPVRTPVNSRDIVPVVYYDAIEREVCRGVIDGSLVINNTVCGLENKASNKGGLSVGARVE